jgi:hypothetical protein
MEICRAGSETNDELIAAARASGALRSQRTAGDLKGAALAARCAVGSEYAYSCTWPCLTGR